MIRWQHLAGPRLARVGKGHQQLPAYVRRTSLASSSSSSRFVYEIAPPSSCRNSSLSETNSIGSRYGSSTCASSSCCCRMWKRSTSRSVCGFSSNCRHLPYSVGSRSEGNDNAYTRPAVASRSSRRCTDNSSPILRRGESSRSSRGGSGNGSFVSNKLRWTTREGACSSCSVQAEGDTRSRSHDITRTSCVDGTTTLYSHNSKRCTDDFYGSNSSRLATGQADKMKLSARFDATVTRGRRATGSETAPRDVALLCHIDPTLPISIANALCLRERSYTLFSYAGSSASMCYCTGFPPGCFSHTCGSPCTTGSACTTGSRVSRLSALSNTVASGGDVCLMSPATSGQSPASCATTVPSHSHAGGGPPLEQQTQQHGPQQQLQQQRRGSSSSSSKGSCPPPFGELLRCTNSRAHEHQVAWLGRPHFVGSPRSFPVPHMKVNDEMLFLALRSSLSTASFLHGGAAPGVSLLLAGDRGVPRASCFFSGVSSNRGSCTATVERGNSPGPSRLSADPASAQQPAAASAASSADTDGNVQQQAQRPQAPLQQPLQSPVRSPVTSSSSYARRRGAAGSTSQTKWWPIFSVYGLFRLGFRAVSSLWSALLRGARTFFKYMRMILSNPMVVKKFWKKGKESAIHTWRWTVTGFSLFYANVRVSYQLLKKKILGHPLRYNEHKLLVRTTADALKLIPFSLMIVIPLGELLLPVMLRLFPNMLPSTFFEKQVDNAYLSRKLKAKQELAAFFQELVREHTKHIIEHESNDALKDKAKALREFQEKLLRKDQKDVNPFLSLKDILSFAKLFKQEFVLEKLDLQTLQVMCKLLGIEPYSLQSHVILQLRYHLNNIQREDREFMWEGVETLSHDELVEACKDRAMMFHSISDEDMREQMRQWLEISSHKDIPPLLLLWCRCITLTHRPIPPPAVDLKGSSATKAAASGKTAAAAITAAGAAGATAASEGALRAGAASAAPGDAARQHEMEPGLAAVPAAAPSPTPTRTTASLQQQQQQRPTEAAIGGQLLRHQQDEAERLASAAAAGDSEQLQQHTSAAHPAKHHAAATEGTGPVVDAGSTAAAAQGQEDRLGEKREEEEEAEDEAEKMKAATLEAMERQVELLRAEEETLRQSVLLLQEEEAQRKKIQEEEAAEAHESESEQKTTVVGERAETAAARDDSSTRDAASGAERREQQHQMRVQPAVFDEARDGSATAAAAPAAAAPAGQPAGVEGEDDASLNELARVRSGREMLQRRARRMELELRLLRQLADMQHHQQEEAFGALSKVLQAAHACRVKQQAMQQLLQLREQQQEQQETANTGKPESDEHLQQHLESERGHQLEVLRQQKLHEAPAAAAATVAAAEFPESVTQLELCVEDVIRRFAEGVQQVEQLMRDAKRFQMNDNDPLFYPEDHSDMEDVPTLPAVPSPAHTEQSHAVLPGPPASSVSAPTSPRSPSSGSSATGAYSTVVLPFRQTMLSTRNATPSGTEAQAEKEEHRKTRHMLAAAASHP